MASGAQSPSSPGTSVHYINANAFADIPESPQEDVVSITTNTKCIDGLSFKFPYHIQIIIIALVKSCT